MSFLPTALGLAAAAVAGAAAASTATSVDERAALVRLAGSVLRVEAPGERGAAVGSAVVVAPERVVTNCHVTRNARSVFVIRGGVSWRAETQSADIERDLCLLEVPGLIADPVAFGATDQLSIGQRVTALGFTGGAMLQRSSGEVRELHRHDGSQVIQASSWFNSGASGGGLFDSRGALAGILTFRLRGGDAHWFAAPVEWVRELVAQPQRHAPMPVMPLPAGRSPYWQQPLAQQPRFLRAAVLQRDRAWTELASLAREWLDHDTGDAEPWQLLGTALESLDRPADARQALSCALALAPTHPALLARAQALNAPAAGSAKSPGACSVRQGPLQ